MNQPRLVIQRGACDARGLARGNRATLVVESLCACREVLAGQELPTLVVDGGGVQCQVLGTDAALLVVQLGLVEG